MHTHEKEEKTSRKKTQSCGRIRRKSCMIIIQKPLDIIIGDIMRQRVKLLSMSRILM